MKSKDFYQILGLAFEATQKEIKQAYQRLARKYHPDVSTISDAEEKFKTMGEAYEVLKDPQKRERYDRLNRQNQRSQTQPREKQRRKTSNKTSGNQRSGHTFNEQRYNEDHASDLNSAFEERYGNRANRGSGFNVEGSDIIASVMIDLEDSINGTSRQFTVQVPTMTSQGELFNKNKTLYVKIPKGIVDGETIHLPKQGSPGMGAAAGDLRLKVAFNQHSLYGVEGSDLYLTLSVSAWVLELGAKIEVPCASARSGKMIVNIPKNSQHGEKLRFEGFGIPSRVPGDFYVILLVSNS